MTETRKHFTAEQKIAILRRRLLDPVAIVDDEKFNVQLSEVWREALRVLAPGGPSDQLGNAVAVFWSTRRQQQAALFSVQIGLRSAAPQS